MSGYRMIPTFRLARRIAHDLQPYPMKSMWKHMMDHHLGLMEKMVDHGEGLSRSWSRRKWMDDAFAPSWWKSCTMDQQSPSAPRREFGRVEFGQDATKFELVVDLGEQVKPDDLEINVRLMNDSELHVEARHEIKSADSGEYRKQYFSKVLSMPAQADIDGLKSTVSDEGLLRVKAPMRAVEEPPQASVREIPIERVAPTGPTPPKSASAETAEGTSKTGATDGV